MSNKKSKSHETGFFVLPVLVTAGSFQCQVTPSLFLEGETTHCSDTSWLKALLNDLKNNSNKSEVIRYTYNGQTVYYADSCKGCADSMGIVYSCSGEVLCQFGGIAGFNTCPDFFEKAKRRKVIWRN